MASKKKKKVPKEGNPVAKNMNKFNKPVTMKDRKNTYSRKDKHKNKADKGSPFSFEAFSHIGISSDQNKLDVENISK